jgi:dipeptidyl aminopeptidase/acylaminoacyl peptidase
MLAVLLTTTLLAASEPKTVPLTNLVKRPEIADIELSPDGKTLAVLAPSGDYASYLLFIDADTMKPAEGFKDQGEFTLSSVTWISNDRVVVTPARKYGGFAEPNETGELIGVNKDGTKLTFLYGSRGAQQVGTRITNRGSDEGYAELASPRIDDEKFTLITVGKFLTDGSFTELHRMDKMSGKHKMIARAPLRRASFLISNEGIATVAYGPDVDGKLKVYVAEGKSDWKLILDETRDGKRLLPIGLTNDAKAIIASQAQVKGPSAIVRFDLKTLETEQIYLPKNAQAVGYIREPGRSEPLAAVTADGDYGFYFFDNTSKIAKSQMAFQKSFPGQVAIPISSSRGFEKILFRVSSGHNSGEYYLYDGKTNKAKFLFPAHSWMDPNEMAMVKPFQLKARDGLDLFGYLTLPRGVEHKGLPMVVMPHGGPHGERDFANYDEWAQVLASRGYAVLKVNFRGSGGYGNSFETAGYQQWGKAMIDDMTDATLWAVKEGYADKSRLAIAGASYGGYASLMSGAREPDLYKAVISYVGVSDLEMMYSRGDIEDSLYGERYLKRVLSDDKAVLRANSPVNLAGQFKAPVLIVHGGQDQRVPVAHGKAMRDALKSAGKSVEYFEVADEMHGFYKEKNVLAGYEKMLAFLDKALAKK